MNITYLGHAGFCVETENTIIVMDPWLSKDGAFDAAWFQYPQNHHMADYINTLFINANKDKYIYISHDHKDHFDITFLTSLTSHDFTVILADFFHPVVKNTLLAHNFQCNEIISLKDNQPFEFSDGFLILYLVDMELDTDSSILVKTTSGTFVNLNDCKNHERLEAINKEHGPIDVFSGQFSGAVWHPTCYKMSPSHYEIICKNKIKGKYELIAKSIERLNPAVYLPSAGPPCFIDPMLLPINFQDINTYPRAAQIIDFLNSHVFKTCVKTRWPETMPGDVFDTVKKEFSYLTPIRVNDNDFKNYVTNYAKQYTEFFNKRAAENALIEPKKVFIALEQELREKLDRMKLVHRNIPVVLYFSLSDYKDYLYVVDFQKNKITTVTTIEHQEAFCLIESPAWQVNKVLTRQITWPDFALTFRVMLERKPDIYNTFVNAFLTLDIDSLERFCQLSYEMYSKKERMTIEYNNKRYSVLRYCPHQGGDLMQGEIQDCFLICPRHQWKFDLENGGACRYNQASIDAICLGPVEKTDNG